MDVYIAATLYVPYERKLPVTMPVDANNPSRALEHRASVDGGESFPFRALRDEAVAGKLGECFGVFGVKEWDCACTPELWASSATIETRECGKDIKVGYETYMSQIV